MHNNIVNYYTICFQDRNNHNSEISESEKNIALTDRQEAIKDLENLFKSKNKF